MERKLQGRYVTVSTAGEKVRAFVPAPLPPKPPIEWTPELRDKFDQAWLSLGRLDSISTFLPDISLFLYMYVRKEAVLSSMIEGTQSSLSDLLLFELDMKPGAPLDDVLEVSNYAAALDLLARRGLPRRRHWTAREYLDVVGRRLPEARPPLGLLTHAHEEVRYGCRPLDGRRRHATRSSVQDLRRALGRTHEDTGHRTDANDGGGRA